MHRSRLGGSVRQRNDVFSCKGRGVCPSGNTRRMVETAAHLTDHVLPRLPVRQWILPAPKRHRYFMQRDGTVLKRAPYGEDWVFMRGWLVSMWRVSVQAC